MPFNVLVAVCLFSTGMTVADENQQTKSRSSINSENFETWRDHILPSNEEQAWKKIPWHSSFKSAILEGHKVKKPILLWTMNGHPLGCT